MKIKNLLLDEIEYVQFKKEYEAWSIANYPWPPEDQELDQSSENPANYESGLHPMAENSVQDSLPGGSN